MWRLLLTLVIAFGLIENAPAEVTHEEIRGTIQSLIYSYNQLDNKLERHEHRTRALGELLKKAMQTLQKGQKNLEPLNGIFARLDERVSQIETMLITQEEKYNVQTDKLGEALATIFKWMADNDECLKRPPIGPNALSSVQPTASPAQAMPNDFVEKQTEINKQMLDKIQALSANVDKLLANSNKMMTQQDAAFKSVPGDLLNKIEDKVAGKASELQTAVIHKFDELNESLTQLQQNKPEAASQGLTPTDRQFIEQLANETLKNIAQVKGDVVGTSSAIEQNLQQLLGGVGSSAAVLEQFYKEVNASYNKFNEGLEIFDKFNNILMTNSEYVLEIQRKVEFGTLQTVQKIDNLIDTHHKGVGERFDKIYESLFSLQMEAVQNISTVIESEINHVWHQIEIMNGEVTDSKDLLNLVQKRNEVYVNSSFSTMDSLSSKVEETKGRMLDMDENLNFLLGKLSVMSQEFKNIKVGLAESLDELRQTFHSAQEKMHQHPGSNTVNEKTEYETEVNLLNKQNRK